MKTKLATLILQLALGLVGFSQTNLICNPSFEDSLTSYPNRISQNNPNSKIHLQKTSILLNVAGAACVMARTIPNFYTWDYVQPVSPGFSVDLRPSLQFGRRNNPSQSFFIVEQAIGYGTYGGGPIYKEVPRQRWYHDVTYELSGYERYHVLQFSSAIGHKFNARESTFGIFLVANNQYLMNFNTIKSSNRHIKRVLIHPGIEVRWFPWHASFISSLGISAERTFGFLTPIYAQHMIHQHLFSLKANFLLYEN